MSDGTTAPNMVGQYSFVEGQTYVTLAVNTDVTVYAASQVSLTTVTTDDQGVETSETTYPSTDNNFAAQTLNWVESSGDDDDDDDSDDSGAASLLSYASALVAAIAVTMF